MEIDKEPIKKSASGAAGETPEDDADLETNSDDVSDEPERKHVSHSTYKKAVAKEKAARERARLAEEKASQLEQEKLAAEGNKDEQIKSLQTKLNETQKKNKDLYGSIAKRTLFAQVKAEATKAGCIDADAVIALANLTELDVDAETFEADPQEVQQVLADLKKSKPYLFSKAGPKINGKLPSGEKPDVEREDISKLTTAQLKERIRQLDKK